MTNKGANSNDDSIKAVFDAVGSDNSPEMLNVLKSILDELDAMVYVTDLETDELLFANRVMRQTFQIDAESAGKPCWSVVQAGMTGRCPFCPLRTLMKDASKPVVWQITNTMNGRVYKNHDSIIKWVDGRNVHLQYAVDITSTVKMENELKENMLAAEREGRVEEDERSQAMLDATPLAASFWDEKGNMLDCNMEAVRMFGLKTKEDYTKHFYDLNPKYQPDGKLTSEKAAEEIEAAFKSGYRRFEWHYLTRNGDPLPVETTLVRVPWKGEYRLAAYSRDLREIRAIEKKRQEAEEHSINMEIQAKVAIAASEAKSHFLSNMSHEIRTPMSAILGLTDLLTYEDLSEKQRSFVNAIKSSASSLLEIINDILDLSKIEAGKLELVPIDFDIYELLEDIRSMFSMLAKEKDISFSMNIMKNVPRFLYADDIRIKQILVNLLSNAVKFTKIGGVSLTAGLYGDMLCFDVSDSGIGIKPENLPDIFGEFAQMDTGQNRAIKGTGLGLPITKSLITMMGGTIGVESEYGSGTVFHVQIPYVAGNSEALASSEKETSFVLAPDAQVLVVDDNEINLIVAANLLKRFDIISDTALSGRQALEMINEKPYDLIFMDHMMPDMDGVETTQRIRQIYSMNELPIVALTANAVGGVRDVLLKAQMNDYLSKPVEIKELNRILSQWLPEEKISYQKK